MDIIEFFVTLGYSIILMCLLIDIEIKPLKGFYPSSLLMLILLVCGAFMWSSFGYRSFMLFYPIFVQLPLFIFFRWIAKEKGIKLFFVLLTVIVLASPPRLLGQILSAAFGYNELVLNVVSIVLYLPLIFLVYKYFRPLFLYMLRNSEKGWTIFCLIPLSYNTFTVIMGRYDFDIIRDKTILWIDALVAVLVIAAYVLILRFFKQTREQLVLQNEQSILAMQISALEARYEAIKETEEKMLICRHDLRHHLHLINAYLGENNLAGMRKYISEIETSITETKLKKYCENEAVNLIMNSYLNIAEKEGIQVDSEVYIPANCSISDMDICVVLANALENAIQACREIEDLSERRIAISCKAKKDKLFIEITNSFSGEVVFVEDLPLSTKENHGFGTKSIAVIVEKYRGLYSFTAEDGLFRARIIM